MAISQAIKNRIEKLERKLLEVFEPYGEENLIPEKTADGWLIEGIVYDTEKEALELADKLRNDGVSAWLDELAKDCWADYDE
ncbi:hypothetical protein [Vagococcus fluvialis]|uniref:hypothetical protein n=1 Tax=Vagococcus fluvialis TaxID=2738 RepID=UPI003B21653B